MNLLSYFNSQPENDIDWGRDAIKFFHNRMVSKYSNYNLTMPQLITKLSTSQTGVPHEDIFLEGLGSAISSIGMSEGQVSDAMEKLADMSGGNIPANQGVFFSALSDRMQDITAGDWIGAAPQIAIESAEQIATGIQSVGNAVIETGKTLTVIGPALIVGAVIFIVYARARQLGGR